MWGGPRLAHHPAPWSDGGVFEEKPDWVTGCCGTHWMNWSRIRSNHLTVQDWATLKVKLIWSWTQWAHNSKWPWWAGMEPHCYGRWVLEGAVWPVHELKRKTKGSREGHVQSVGPLLRFLFMDLIMWWGQGEWPGWSIWTIDVLVGPTIQATQMSRRETPSPKLGSEWAVHVLTLFWDKKIMLCLAPLDFRI